MWYEAQILKRKLISAGHGSLFSRYEDKRKDGAMSAFHLTFFPVFLSGHLLICSQKRRLKKNALLFFTASWKIDFSYVQRLESTRDEESGEKNSKIGAREKYLYICRKLVGKIRIWEFLKVNFRDFKHMYHHSSFLVVHMFKITIIVSLQIKYSSLKTIFYLITDYNIWMMLLI